MAPAGSYEALQAAIDAGADAVYFGVGTLNMRARSSANFGLDDMTRIVQTAHEHGVRAYLTVNTIVYDGEMEELSAVIARAAEVGVDAVIASDIAAIMCARRAGLEVHISTQCNISNTEAVKFYSQWADVVVLARELSLPQIRHIAREIETCGITGPAGLPVRIEMFAHGALCMCYSGQCGMSALIGGRSGNRGRCAQPCRQSYGYGRWENKYPLSLKDNCLVGDLASLEAMGYLIRLANPKDGRSHLLIATETAEGLRNSKAQVETTFYEWLLAELPEEEKNAFCETLDKL